MEAKIGIYYFPDLSCDEAEALNSIPGHSWHACFDVPGWGAVVFVAAPEMEPDAPVDISTPDGDVVMTVQEMKDAGYISEAQISVEIVKSLPKKKIQKTIVYLDLHQ